jgi:hypothetical protein
MKQPWGTNALSPGFFGDVLDGGRSKTDIEGKQPVINSGSQE